MRPEGDVELLSAAVSPLVAGAVAGPTAPRRVIGAFAGCVYVELGAHDRVLALLAADALQLPVGLRLSVPSAHLDWGVGAGDSVLVGAGRVALPGRDVVAARLARPARVRPTGRAAQGAANCLPDPGVLGELAHDLTRAVLAGRSVDDGLRGLVGAGRGLTPSGDDAVCGVLLALGALADPAAAPALAELRCRLHPLLGRTTSLSAALLTAAASGYAVPDVTRLLTLLLPAVSSDPSLATERVASTDSDPVGPVPDPAAYGPVLDRVLAIGHSSGRDLLSGVSGAVRAVAESARPAPRSRGARRA